MPLDLPLSGFAANLQHQVADLRHAGRAHRMALRFQAAAGVHWPLAPQRRAPCKRVRPALSLFHEPQVFGGDDLGDGEAVVQLGELDLARRHAGHPVRLFARAPNGRKSHNVRLLVQRYVIRALRDPQHPNWF